MSVSMKISLEIIENTFMKPVKQINIYICLTKVFFNSIDVTIVEFLQVWWFE